MTTEEKIQYFYDVAINEAQEDAEKLLQEHKKELETLLEEHKRAKDLEIAQALKAETSQASHEINKSLSSSLLEIKRERNRYHSQYKEKIFQEVLGLLEQFRETDAYGDYLERKIREALDLAGEDPVTIYLSVEDSARLSRISEKMGVSLELAGHSFLGGIRAEIPEKNILMDSSFLEAYNSEKEGFTFDGGLDI